MRSVVRKGSLLRSVRGEMFIERGRFESTQTPLGVKCQRPGEHHIALLKEL